MFRPALARDAVALRDLERAANLLALAHVFPPSDFAFPDVEVLARWVQTLDDAGVTVEVLDDAAGLACYVAYDDATVRHLAVHPARWGEGLARRALVRAAGAIRARGNRPRLWCLVANSRAQGLYAHLGWTPTGEQRRAQWRPHPPEVELVLDAGLL